LQRVPPGTKRRRSEKRSLASTDFAGLAFCRPISVSLNVFWIY
jgi:hypothetical protein